MYIVINLINCFIDEMHSNVHLVNILSFIKKYNFHPGNVSTEERILFTDTFVTFKTLFHIIYSLLLVKLYS